MRAWQVHDCGEPRDVLCAANVPTPQPGAGELRVRVTAAGIGLPDVLMCRGTYPLTPARPFTPGQEVCGVVTAAGDGVDVAVGTRVMGVTMFTAGHGSFAEECLVGAQQAFGVPEGLSDAHAAGFWIPHMTAWIGLVERGRIEAGEWLAVLGGAGGSGAAAIQLGKALGARVVAVVSNDERAAFCRQLGADATVDRGAGDVGAQLRELTGGRGVDVVYDPVGGAVAESAASGLARDGRLLAVGFASGHWPRLPTAELVVANTSLLGVFAGGYSRAELEPIHRRLCGHVASGALRDVVTSGVAFDDLPAALQRLADGHAIGKLVLVL